MAGQGECVCSSGAGVGEVYGDEVYCVSGGFVAQGDWGVLCSGDCWVAFSQRGLCRGVFWVGVFVGVFLVGRVYLMGRVFSCCFLGEGVFFGRVCMWDRERSAHVCDTMCIVILW